MSDDWDTVTKIGSKAHGGAAGPREKVIRGEAALNAARRQGAAIATEKKYSTANQKGGSEGQLLTKVDRSDDIVKPKTVDDSISKTLKTIRPTLKNQKGQPMTQTDLANKIGENVAVVQAFENGKAAPNEGVVIKMERALGYHLRGKNIGQKIVRGKKNQAAAASGS
ncbi:multi protein-bridging factor 1 [Microthyrium microscopicum]|uniref:Multiprotein-bridging factor 1 n=1 Tax=Microthyrium microscopicum TaxID=703497 RepID=A0A6A6TZZ9_9PEZI|nr:multi protein-bridging factor 1 [Microthyrium microscopicum]